MPGVVFLATAKPAPQLGTSKMLHQVATWAREARGFTGVANRPAKDDMAKVCAIFVDPSTARCTARPGTGRAARPGLQLEITREIALRACRPSKRASCRPNLMHAMHWHAVTKECSHNTARHHGALEGCCFLKLVHQTASFSCIALIKLSHKFHAGDGQVSILKRAG